MTQRLAVHIGRFAPFNKKEKAIEFAIKDSLVKYLVKTGCVSLGEIVFRGMKNRDHWVFRKRVT